VSNLIKSIAVKIPVLIVRARHRSRARLFPPRHVMNQGQVLMAGTPEEVRATAAVRRSTPAPARRRSRAVWPVLRARRPLCAASAQRLLRKEATS